MCVTVYGDLPNYLKIQLEAFVMYTVLWQCSDRYIDVFQNCLDPSFRTFRNKNFKIYGYIYIKTKNTEGH